MQDCTIETVTDTVIAQMATTPDARLREIMDSLVRHLHAFAREVRLTPEEWLRGIAFLTAVGQTCTPHRQEFILLSDVLGLSRLVNLMHDAEGREEVATETSLLGPFFRENAPVLPLGSSIARTPSQAEIVLYGTVRDAEGRPIAGATLDVWQTDEHGLYDLQRQSPEEMDLRGRFVTDAEGRYHLRTVKPLGYSIPMDGPVGDLIRAQKRHGFRPAHIHMMVGAPGYRELVTALYFADDPHIDSDTVFGVSAALLVRERHDDANAPLPGLPSVRFDIVLSRARDQAAGRVGADPARVTGAGRVGADPQTITAMR